MSKRVGGHGSRKRSLTDIRSFFQNPNKVQCLSGLDQGQELSSDANATNETDSKNEENGTSKTIQSGDAECSSKAQQLMNDIGSKIGKRLQREEIAEMLLNHWTPSPNFKFPKTSDGQQTRSFQQHWLTRYDWLVYSRYCSGGFCKFCVMFAHDEAGGQKLGKFVTEPWTSYKYATGQSGELPGHAKHDYHLFSAARAGEFLRIWKTNQSVCSMVDNQNSATIAFNKRRLVPIIKTIIFSARCKLPLRGHRDNEDLKSQESIQSCLSGQHGVFLGLLAFRIDAGDTDLKNHLENSNKKTLMISPGIQNDVISCIGKYLQSLIVEKVKKNKFFSILCDETTDCSTKEQMSICVRYVDLDTSTLREDFLAFVNVTRTTGASLQQYLEDFMQKVGLDYENLRGQGYDGGANMSGKFRGLQVRVLEKQQLALYVHCFSHKLNLTVSKACQIPLVRNMMGIVGSVSTFLSASAKRVAVLNEVIENSEIPEARKKKLKPLCQTRWVERHNSLMVFSELYPFILDALQKIKEDTDSIAASSANMYEATVTRCDFIVTLQCSVSVLSHTLGLSVLLQSPKLDISSAVSHVQSVIQELQTLRKSSVESFKKVFTVINDQADAAGIEVTIPRTCGRQAHRSNIKTSSPEEYYRSSVYVPLLDCLIDDLTSRFSGQVNEVFALQGLIPSFHGKIAKEDILQAAQFYEVDLPYVAIHEIETELALWYGRWKHEPTKPASAVDAIQYCDDALYPNIRVLLQLFATLPITTASVERTFSVLGLLKTYLRSTISEERLNGLALPFIYKTIEIAVDAIVNLFARLKPRKLELLDWEH